MLRRRLEIASSGVTDYERKEFADAIQSFRSYIAILEEWKKCPPGGLMPSHFDRKLDLPEMLLISGVFWDLAKLFDRSKRHERDFRMYLDKYVLFTKGMPYESLCIETLRKFINLGKPIHRDEFKKAFVKLGGKNCFIANALSPELPESSIDSLRAFRDQRLTGNPIGLELAYLYYSHGKRAVPHLLSAPQWVRIGIAFTLRIAARALAPPVKQTNG